MANELYIPYANPGKWVDINYAQLPKYLTRHFEDYLFEQSQLDFNQYETYFQKWQRNDVATYQFESNFDPITAQVINEIDVVKATINVSAVRANRYLAGFNVYEFQVDWSQFPEGCYFIKIITAVKVCISEPISLKNLHKHTVLFEYKNSRYHRDVIYETGIGFCFRVEGILGALDPGSTDLFYNDQKYNPYQLSSQPYNNFQLKVGGPRGLPDWVIRLYNELWSCNDVRIDGKSYCKSSDTKLEIKDQQRFPKRSIAMLIREGINRGSQIFTGDFDVNKKVSVVFNIDANMFGDLNGGNPEIVPITDFE